MIEMQQLDKNENSSINESNNQERNVQDLKRKKKL